MLLSFPGVTHPFSSPPEKWIFMTYKIPRSKSQVKTRQKKAYFLRRMYTTVPRNTKARSHKVHRKHTPYPLECTLYGHWPISANIQCPFSGDDGRFCTVRGARAPNFGRVNRSAKTPRVNVPPYNRCQPLPEKKDVLLI